MERHLISAIESDMRRNLDEADRVLTGNETRNAALRVVLDSSPADLEAIPADSVQRILWRVAFVSTFTPYDGAIRTADLSALRDPILRGAIGTWAGVVTDATETTQLLFAFARELRPTFGEPALRAMNALPAGDEGAHPLVGLRANGAFVRAALAMEVTVSAYANKVMRVRAETETVLNHLRD